MDILSQIAIVIFGGSAIWLVGRPEHWSRWGYVLGLCGQPFWFYVTIAHKQWGITVLCCWYTYSWAQGAYYQWVKKGGSK